MAAKPPQDDRASEAGSHMVPPSEAQTAKGGTKLLVHVKVLPQDALSALLPTDGTAAGDVTSTVPAAASALQPYRFELCSDESVPLLFKVSTRLRHLLMVEPSRGLLVGNTDDALVIKVAVRPPVTIAEVAGTSMAQGVQGTDGSALNAQQQRTISEASAMTVGTTRTMASTVAASASSFPRHDDLRIELRACIHLTGQSPAELRRLQKSMLSDGTFVRLWDQALPQAPFTVQVPLQRVTEDQYLAHMYKKISQRAQKLQDERSIQAARLQAKQCEILRLTKRKEQFEADVSDMEDYYEQVVGRPFRGTDVDGSVGEGDAEKPWEITRSGASVEPTMSWPLLALAMAAVAISTFMTSPYTSA